MKEVRGLGDTNRIGWAGHKLRLAGGLQWCRGVLGGRGGPRG